MEKDFCLPEADGTPRMVEMMYAYDKMIRERGPVRIMEQTVNRATWLVLVSEQDSCSRGTTSQKKWWILLPAQKESLAISRVWRRAARLVRIQHAARRPTHTRGLMSME